MIYYAHETEEVYRRDIEDLQLLPTCGKPRGPNSPAQSWLFHHVGIFSIVHRVTHQNRVRRLLCEGRCGDRRTQTTPLNAMLPSGSAAVRPAREARSSMAHLGLGTASGDGRSGIPQCNEHDTLSVWAGGVLCSKLTVPAIAQNETQHPAKDAK